MGLSGSDTSSLLLLMIAVTFNSFEVALEPVSTAGNDAAAGLHESATNELPATATHAAAATKHDAATTSATATSRIFTAASMASVMYMHSITPLNFACLIQNILNRSSQQMEMPSSTQDDQQQSSQGLQSSTSTAALTSTTPSSMATSAQMPHSSPAMQQQLQEGQGQPASAPATMPTPTSGSATTATSAANSAGGVCPPNQQQQQQPLAPPPSQQQQSKEINTATVCRIGQETVQEIVGRIQEVFNYLKTLQPPVGNPATDRSTLEKQQRLNEVLKGITQVEFKSENVQDTVVMKF